MRNFCLEEERLWDSQKDEAGRRTVDKRACRRYLRIDNLDRSSTEPFSNHLFCLLTLEHFGKCELLPPPIYTPGWWILLPTGQGKCVKICESIDNPKDSMMSLLFKRAEFSVIVLSPASSSSPRISEMHILCQSGFIISHLISIV